MASCSIKGYLKGKPAALKGKYKPDNAATIPSVNQSFPFQAFPCIYIGFMPNPQFATGALPHYYL